MSILEDPAHEARAQEWRSAFARTLNQQKERAKELLNSRREKFSALQADIALRLAELADELARQQADALERGISLDSEQAAVGARQAALQQQGEQLTAQYRQWEEAQANGRAGQEQLLAQVQQRLAELDLRHAAMGDAGRELQIERSEFAERQAELEESLAGISTKKAELEERSRQLAEQQSELAANSSQLEEQRQTLKKREQALQRQRRSVARQLRARKAELAAEVDLLHKEATAVPGQDFEIQLRCSELQGKCDRLREEGAELAQQREDLQERFSTVQQQLAQRQGEWSQAQKQAGEIQARLKQLESQQAEITRERDQLKADKMRLSAELEKVRAEYRAKIAEVASGREQQTAGEASTSIELQRLRDENKQLEAWLNEATAAAEAAKADAGASSGEASPGSSQELADLHRRLEMATSDCRELKSKNSELQDQLAKGGSSGSKSDTKSPAPAGSQGMDWEAQKQRMLARLEADYDDTDPVQKADRMTVENALQVTEDALAAKDQQVAEVRREVEELRSLLENQSSSIGQFAVGAAAFAGMLDKDELVRHERESLQKMQEAMREQLKQAEIDISMERAKIARDRAELDEQLHALQREKAQQAASDPASGGDKGKKPARGRWLSRLGLSDGEKS